MLLQGPELGRWWFQGGVSLEKVSNILEQKFLRHNMEAVLLKVGEAWGRGGPSTKQMLQMLLEFQWLTGHFTGSTIRKLGLVP